MKRIIAQFVRTNAYDMVTVKAEGTGYPIDGKIKYIVEAGDFPEEKDKRNEDIIREYLEEAIEFDDWMEWETASEEDLADTEILGEYIQYPHFVIMDEVNGNIFFGEIETNDKDEAIRELHDTWEHLSEHDKKRRTSYELLHTFGESLELAEVVEKIK